MEPLRLGVEHLAVTGLGQLLHLRLKIINQRLDLRAPGAQILGRLFHGGDAVDTLKVGDALVEGGGDVGAGSFYGVESLVHRGGVGGTGTVEVREAAGPLLVVLIESPIEVFLGFLDLIEDELQAWIHST